MISGLLTAARAEYSDWCSDAINYHLKLDGHPLDVRVGDGGPRVRRHHARRPLVGQARFGHRGLTGVSSYTDFTAPRAPGAAALEVSLLRRARMRADPRR